MVIDVQNKNRGWDTIYFYDISRLSRLERISANFDFLAENHGVKLVFCDLPDTDDPVMKAMMRGISGTFARVHSERSKQLGFEGAKNKVLIYGSWPGGTAPRGYDRISEQVSLDDGRKIRITKLVPNQDAHAVSLYLQLRADGHSRTIACRESGLLNVSQGSLVYIEQNANKVYCGHTVWNQHNEKTKGHGYKGGTRYKDIGKWIWKRNTHEQLISEDIAERVISNLKKRKLADSKRYRSLLSGLLITENNEKWQSNYDNRTGRHSYRVQSSNGNRQLSQSILDDAVLNQMISDVQSPEFIDEILQSIHKKKGKNGDVNKLSTSILALENKSEKLIDLLIEDIPREPVLQRIKKIQNEISQKKIELENLNKKSESVQQMRGLTKNRLALILRNVFEDLEKKGDIYLLRSILAQLLEKIVLSPVDFECTIYYTLPLSREKQGLATALLGCSLGSTPIIL